MNEKQVISKLKTLKRVQPNARLLKDIKEDVYLQLHLKENDSSTKKSTLLQRFLFSKQSQYIAASFVVFFGFIFLSYVIFTGKIENIILNTKLAFAPNQYEKASIALSDTTSRYNQNVDKNNVADISYALSLTNTQMSGLKLKGEEGRYTAKQCHDLYQQYFTYLQKEYKTTPQSFPQLKSQISTYEEQAETKLNMYHNL